MEKFVNDLLKSPCDLSSLTHGIIRKKYLVHTDQEGCSDRERAKLKAIVEERMVKKVTDQNKRADSSVGQNVSKVAVTHGKQREKEKNKGTRRKVETSERDKQSERPSKTHSPTSACEDAGGNVGEPSHDSSDFEVSSPVTKTVRRSSKRRLSSSDDSDTGSDSEPESVQIVEKKKSRDSLQQKTKKRRTVKPPTSDSEGSDGGHVGGKRQKRGSGDGKQVVSLICSSDSESGQFGNSRSKARRNGKKIKAKKKKPAVSDSECEDVGRNDSDSGDVGRNDSDSGDVGRNDSDSGDGGAETKRDSRRKRQVSDSDSTCDHLTGDDDAVNKMSVNRTDKKASKRLSLMHSDTDSDAEMDNKQITASKSHGKKPNSNIASGKSNHSQKLDSGDSSDDVADPDISENLRKRGDISDSESMCSNLTSDDDSVRKKGKSVKRPDKKKKTKKRPGLVDSDNDQRVEKHIGVSGRQKMSPKGRKPKSSVTTGKSNRKQNQKQDAERKSKNRAPSSSDDSDTASESPTSKSAATHSEVGRGRKHTAQRETKRSSVKGRVASSSDEELPLSKAARRESQSSDSSDTDKSSSDANHDGESNKGKRTETKVTTKDAKGAKTSRVSGRVRNLKAILRACNLMPVGRMHTVVFGECRNDKDYVRKLKRLLVDAGMSDPPTMKKAKEIRLKKELSELDGGNIISCKGRSVRRCRDTIDYGAPVAEPVKRLVMPACGAFKNLSRLVDSEGSDSSP